MPSTSFRDALGLDMAFSLTVSPRIDGEVIAGESHSLRKAFAYMADVFEQGRFAISHRTCYDVMTCYMAHNTYRVRGGRLAGDPSESGGSHEVAQLWFLG